MEHFSKAVALGGSPDGEIGLIYSHLAQGDIPAAAELANAVIGRFTPADFTMIAPVMRWVCKSLGESGAGWASITADGRLVGAVDRARLEKGVSLKAVVASSGETVASATSKQLSSQAARLGIIDGFTAFELKLPPGAASEVIRVTFAGIDLIGSPASAPSGARIEGFVDRLDGQIVGWVTLAGHPGAGITIRLIDRLGQEREFPTTRSAVSSDSQTVPADEVGRRHFTIDLAESGLDDSRIEVWGWLPGLGAGHQLAGSPLSLLATRPKIPSARMPLRRGKDDRRALDIIVPVFGSATETLACLKSVIETRALYAAAVGPCDIVVVDDGSPDKDLVKALESLSEAGEISLLHNSRNLGFPTAVNRGFDLHPDRDVVVLNSDTIVFSDWLSRLREAAYSSLDIATVTPFSNEASILSYPLNLGDNPEPSLDEAKTLDRMAAKVNAGIVIDIPTAVGFCMYIRRDCLDQIGVFDIEAFGRGYGEENDLCMRAMEAGWRNVAAPNIFLSHVGGSSFGVSKQALIVRNTAILNGLHPGYDALVRDFIAADPLAGARRNIDIARLSATRIRPTILLITLALAGGVARYVQEAAEAYAARGLKTFILRPLKSDDDDSRACLIDPFDPTLCNLIFDLPTELDALLALLVEREVGKVEIHHFLGLDSNCFAITDRLRVPYEVILHDYSWLCPRINLVDGRGQYCGMPLDPEVCDRCVAIDGQTLAEAISVGELRQRSARVLSRARRVVAPSRDVIYRFGEVISDAPYEVTPWEDQSVAAPADVSLPADGQRLRVAIIGAIGEQKGYELILACARDAAMRDLPIEFVVIGHTSDDLRLFKTGRVFVTGRYDDAEAVELVRAQSCHFAFQPSISPETWSYTLTVAWKSGLRVLAFDFGAIAERIRDSGFGKLIPFSFDEKQINQALLNFGGDDTAAADLAAVSPAADVGEIAMTAADNAALVTSISDTGEAGQSPHGTIIALEAGLYAFTARIADEKGANLALPAVHVSLVAGHTRDVKVDFLGKHDPVDNWLTERGDVVVVRISGGSCSLSVRCVRAPGKVFAPIAVECRRLDDGAPQVQEAAPVAPNGIIAAQITAHIQNKGDVPFIVPGWVGYDDERLWIEALTINPLEDISPDDIEYKALTGSGFETPWISGGNMCGTRGSSNPLIAFAVRLRGAAAENYECRYHGRFMNGAVTGPFRDGAACRSTYGRDPLVGLELEILERTEPSVGAMEDVQQPSLPDYEVVYGSN